jgi:TRAP-type C4-dicarboxylate transport system permease small subunit
LIRRGGSRVGPPSESSIVNRLSAVYGRLLDALAIAAAVILLAMVALVTADIVLRNTGGGGFVWSNEVSEYALYAITLLTAPWLLRRGQHVRLDLVLILVPTRIAWPMEAIGDLIGLATCLLLLRYGLAMTFDSWRLGSITIKNLYFPEWWLLAPLPLTFLLLAVEFVFRFKRLLDGDRTRRADATSVG